MKGQWPLVVGGLGGQGGEPFGRREVLGSLLNHPLPFLEHVHELDPDACVVGCVERFEPQHGSSAPFDGAMILLDEVVYVCHLPDDAVGPCSSLSRLSAASWASRPSMVIISGTPLRRIACVRKRSAASGSRCSVSSTSMVWPYVSTAR